MRRSTPIFIMSITAVPPAIGRTDDSAEASSPEASADPLGAAEPGESPAEGAAAPEPQAARTAFQSVQGPAPRRAASTEGASLPCSWITSAPIARAVRAASLALMSTTTATFRAAVPASTSCPAAGGLLKGNSRRSPPALPSSDKS